MFKYENILSDVNINIGEGKDYLILPTLKNARWIIELGDYRNKLNSFLIYQPSSIRGKIFKCFVIFCPNRLLSLFFKRQLIKLNFKESFIDKLFTNSDNSYSVYLGNGSVHNKATIQLSRKNNPYAYFKFSQNNTVRNLFENESKILDVLMNKFNISNIPIVMYHGAVNDLGYFATSSIRTRESKFIDKIKSEHVDFLIKIYKSTSREKITYDGLVLLYKSRIKLACNQIPIFKQHEYNFDNILKQCSESEMKYTLAHKDFTPWNSFFNNEQIYVFDWEYAE